MISATAARATSPRPESHHDHLIDVETGKVIEFVDPELEQLQKAIAERLGFRLVDHRMELYGVVLDRKVLSLARRRSEAWRRRADLPRSTVLGWMRIGLRASGSSSGCWSPFRSIICGACCASDRPGARIFLAWAGRMAGARVERVGVPLKRDVFYISNHLSWIDILAIAGQSGTAFVAKEEIREGAGGGLAPRRSTRRSM